MLIASTLSHLVDLAKVLIQTFPKCKPWLNWWMNGDVSGMIFSAQRCMDQESWNALPSTTNAQESKHCDYYRVTEKHKSVREAIRGCYLYALNAWAEVEQLHKGLKIQYGQTPHPVKSPKADKSLVQEEQSEISDQKQSISDKSKSLKIVK